ncbi:MAG TPA: succinylglutamate desuccinylase/aspartoacylase family protein [Terriglobia bacterium]|nr:succinylglutamate desuccinylase/aspartoacylase family protein [Terriglobia bacterium]
MRSATSLCREICQPGKKVEYSWTPASDIEVPLLLCRGLEAGPLVVATAGIHGDEYEGMQAVWKVYESLIPQKMRGDFLGVPIAHVAAYRGVSRESPLDGKNLARSFPGRLEGTVTERLAHFLFQEVVLKSDLVMDFHSGGIKYRFLPLVGYYDLPNESSAKSLQVARCMPLGFRWKLPHTPGVLTYEASKLNIPAIGAEYLGEGKLDPNGVSVYVDGIMAALRHLGILAGGDGPHLPQTAIEGDWMLASQDGFFQSSVAVGQRVCRNQELGAIVAVSGKLLQEFKASQDGLVLGIRTVAHIGKGDWAVAVVKEAD